MGLFAAGVVQVLLTMPLTAATYARWWSAVTAPVILLAIAASCVAGLRSRHPRVADRWIVAMCGLTLIGSITSSMANMIGPVRAANALIPLVQLGAFAAGLATGWPTWSAAVLMMLGHRIVLVVTGAGTLGDHITSATWETASFLAATIGGIASQRLARRLDAADAELTASTAAQAEFDYRVVAVRKHAALLHDLVLNQLFALGLGASGPAFRAQLRAVTDELRDRLAMTPHRFGLERSLSDHVGQAVTEAEKARGLTVDLVIHGTGPVMTPIVADGVYLVVREALRNVARHSGVTRASVTVDGRPDRWTVTVADQGVGFDVDAERPGRLGIRSSMIERMSDLNGTLTIHSTPGVGTVVTAQWPKGPDPAPEDGRSRARRRWTTVGEIMWGPIRNGLAVLAAVNLAILLANRAAYRSVPVVLGLWLVMTGVAFLVWRRSPSGIGPGGTVAGVVSAVGGYLVMAWQLPGAEVVGPANWAAGYGATALVLVPYSRPAAEVFTAAIVVLAANAGIAVQVTHDALGHHLAALSVASAPSIVIGATLLIRQLHRTVEIGDRRREEARLREQVRAVEHAAASQSAARRAGREQEALELLRAVAEDRAGPDIRGRAADLQERLRAEVTLLLRQSYLQALVSQGLDARRAASAEDVPAAGPEVHDEHNLGRSLSIESCRLLVSAVIAAAEQARVALWLYPAIDRPGTAHVIVRVLGASPPTTPDWHELHALPGTTVVERPGRLFVELHLPLRPDPRRP